MSLTNGSEGIMKSTFELPCGYRQCLHVDLAKNKKLFLLVNLAAALIGVALAIAGIVICPISATFDAEEYIWMPLLRFGVLMIAFPVYIVLHELVHGLFIRIFSGKGAHYKFTLAYASAGSDAYFGKWSYIVIALSPVVLLGALLAVLCALLPATWFWVAYAIQILNLSGAAGDYYVTLRFCTLPRDILVRDSGTAMTVYTPEGEA